jgi:SsrA-binding protein
MSNKIEIKNKKASFNYHLIDKYMAGIQLFGTEIKSIRQGKASLAESYCYFSQEGELYAKDLHISEYTYGTHYNHEPKRERKLLLTKRELKKLRKGSKEKGYTIVPVRMFVNNKGLAKLEIALAQGKHTYDKRQDIKDKDMKRTLDRRLKV